MTIGCPKRPDVAWRGLTRGNNGQDSLANSDNPDNPAKPTVETHQWTPPPRGISEVGGMRKTRGRKWLPSSLSFPLSAFRFPLLPVAAEVVVEGVGSDAHLFKYPAVLVAAQQILGQLEELFHLAQVGLVDIRLLGAGGVS